MRTLLSLLLTLTVQISLGQGALAPQNTTKSGALLVGDDAPALSLDWLKGAPVKEFKEGEVYVVEFWATWCQPCEVTIPHLTELAKKHKSKANIIGVSVWETPDTELDAVKEYVADKGDTMDYLVARDHQDTMAETWMMAARQTAIPTAFIINGQGKIAWIGHPMELDDPLQKVIDGKWDIQAARLAAQKEIETLEKVNTLNTRLEMAMIMEDFPAAAATIDELITLLPDNKTAFLGLKAELMLDFDEAKAYPLIKELFTGGLAELPEGLNQLAWAIVDPDKTRKAPDYKLARDMAKKASELTKFQDALILDTYGLALFKAGDIKEAVKIQSQAIDIAKKDPNILTEQIVEFTERLDQFKKALDQTAPLLQ